MRHDELRLPPPKVVRLSDVEPEQVEWLWPGRIPLGKLVVLDGDPAAGKSTLALDIAARVTTGAPWPDGAPGRTPTGVLLLSAEDGLADTIAPRLHAAGADTTRVHALQAVPVQSEHSWEWALPNLSRDVATIGELMHHHGIALVIVDVLMGFLSERTDSHKDQAIRAALGPLAAAAAHHRATVLLIRHLRKSGGASAIYRGGGSIGIIGAARAAFLIARHPADPDRRVLAITKSNLAVEPPALAYRSVGAPKLGCARVEWEVEPLAGVTADDLLAPPSDGITSRSAAETWLTDYLDAADHPIPAAQVRRDGEQAAYSWRTLQRSATKIAVVERAGFGTGSTWRPR